MMNKSIDVRAFYNDQDIPERKITKGEVRPIFYVLF